MKVWSGDKPEVYAVSGQELRIHWDIQEVTKEGMDGNDQTTWEANEALCSVFCNRSQIIEAIIGSVMDTGAEIAAINNRETDPEEYEAYQAFRTLAKQLADGWIATW
jgi:hypothetical protein